MQRRRFTEEFKREAVKLASQPGASTAAIASDLGINANLLGRWKRERDESGSQSVTGNAASVSPAEFERMRRELAKVKMERDILKKARALRCRPQVKYAFIARHRHVWPTRTMCRVIGVSTSGFYDWLKRPESLRAQANARLLSRIREAFTSSDRTYGSPRVVLDLRDAGETCSENRVARLMRLAGLKARHKRRRTPGQLVSPVHSIAPNLLERQFEATGPNQKWAADFTYVWTAEGWLFVAVVLDLYSRRVVGWSMQPTMTAQLVMDALLMAIFRRGRPRAVIHHSDQGSQYTSEDFQRLLDSHGIVCSMSRRGNCWDNAAMESFFSTLKTERLSRKHYRTRDELRADVFDYIERFYNPRRRHSTIGYLSPVQFENLQCA
ncbi:IS3 family transposase [Keguizhuia sedimenti]|uniref:IS3 family transposase n=1 Tax=Keguizhuia sedimenti TaxID=3064264 RepID=UPI003BB1880B